jgi:mannose-6-phosphate isomerase
LITPIRLVPFLRPMPWGGRGLEEILHKALPTADDYGESWELSDHSVHDSMVAEGPCAGAGLRKLMETQREAILGAPQSARFRRFPWLVKFLDARGWLSVQVHPNDEQAARLCPSERGKTEAWFVLRADPVSRIYAGLKDGVDSRALRASLAAGTVVDCLESFVPTAGDCLFLPAGTVHAVGGGVLLAEFQQNSDATFRLFDWNRRDAQGKTRTLHVEESLACIDWSGNAVHPLHVPEFAELTRTETTTRSARHELVTCPYFELAYHQVTQPFELGGCGRMQVCQCLCGQGRLGDSRMTTGQTWLLPAASSAVMVSPEPALALLVSTLP